MFMIQKHKKILGISLHICKVLNENYVGIRILPKTTSTEIVWKSIPEGQIPIKLKIWYKSWAKVHWKILMSKDSSFLIEFREEVWCEIINYFISFY